MSEEERPDRSENVAKELRIHGGKWATAHGSYFSDPAKAAPLVDAAHETVEKHHPDVIADIGGGTGFLLDQIRSCCKGISPRFINVDVSSDQLEVCRRHGVDTMLCSALDLQRESLVKDGEKLMLISRSVMHYFGQEDQERFLRSLRHVCLEGEMLVQQAASFATVEEKKCMNKLYPMMGVDKFYFTPEELREAHERNGWKVEDMLVAPPLDLCSEDLAERYALGDEQLQKMCAMLRHHGLHQGLFDVGDRRFRGPFTYRIVVAKAI